METFANASFSPQRRHSHSGMCTFAVSGGAFHLLAWESRGQSFASTSTAEAETIVLASGCTQKWTLESCSTLRTHEEDSEDYVDDSNDEPPAREAAPQPAQHVKVPRHVQEKIYSVEP
eukprot:4597611-Amphidinium_carterae.1